MSEFDWSQDIKPDHRNGAGISGEELYQVFIERMQREGWIEKRNDYAMVQAYAMRTPHAEDCASRRGQNLCTCRKL